MSNGDPEPREQVCAAGPAAAPELIEPRLVPLGGPRAMTVRRTLPSRVRSMIGPFCFADHYGPDDIAATGGMDVAPHPHIGLQTVTWLFEGAVLHRDALGSVQVIEPGQLNLMTAGAGICHSEEGTLARFPDQRVLRGVQLWTALPEAARHGDRSFEHVADVPVVAMGDSRVRVFMGSLVGATSPARVFSPLVAAQVDLPAGARVTLPVDARFEHGILVDDGEVTVGGHTVAPAWLAYLPPGTTELVLEAGANPARLVLLGGEPFDEQILMWWNFVGRTHEEVVEARRAWQAAVAGAPDGVARFGQVVGYDGPPLPAPELPGVRLKPRAR